MATDSDKYDSRIYFGGKRLAEMREIAEAEFKSFFLSIEINKKDRVFVIRVENADDIKKVEDFTNKYQYCRVIGYPRIEYSILRGKKEPI